MPMDARKSFCLTLHVSIDGSNELRGLKGKDDGKWNGPKRTLRGAAEEIALRRQAGDLTGPVRVLLHGGRHFLSTAEKFGPEHSWPTVFEAAPGEKPVLDGGLPISNWQKAKLNGVPVWKADARDILTAYGRFRQLFVNGVRATPSRHPKKGVFIMEDVPGLDTKKHDGGKTPDTPDFGQDFFIASKKGFKGSWRNPQAMDVVAMYTWVTSRHKIKSFDPERRMVYLDRKSPRPFVDSGTFAKYYVENVVDELREPGEWALDTEKGCIYYVPLKGEGIDNAECFVSLTETLLRFEGRPDSNEYVEHLTFRNLAFEHSNWTVPECAGQSDINVRGAVEATGARLCKFENCRFEHIGGYTFRLDDGCQSNAVVGCEMRDLGGGGILANGSDASGSLARRTRDNRYTDNHIHEAGRVFRSSCGIITRHSAGNLIAHNLIHDIYYSGISCGWVWGYGDSVSCENRIEFNHIHKLGQGVLSDMGGIYTLGIQPGTRINNNLIHDIERAHYGGWAIYPDEGSSHIVIENNVCYNVSSSPFHQHYGRENLVMNNIFAFGRDGLFALSAGRMRNTKYGHPGTNFNKSVRLFKNVILSDGTPIFLNGYRTKFEDGDIQSDMNLIYDVSVAEPSCGDPANGKTPAKRLSWEAWLKLDHDTHSIVADPEFKDPANGDFRMPADSPAWSIGFKQIDLSDVGPRPERRRQDFPVME
jgi:hypothetical protein